MWSRLLAAVAAAALALPALGALQDVAKAQSTRAKSNDLTPDEIAEREQRKDCKVAICAAMRAQKAGDDVACTVIKSWRKENLDEIVKRRASRGHGVVCAAPRTSGSSATCLFARSWSRSSKRPSTSIP